MDVCNDIREKLSWAVASILSLVYAISFYAVSNGHIPNNLLFGFCVWGSPDSPNEENGCTNSVQNSHKSAFIVDLVFTLAVGIFYFLDKSKSKKTIIYLAYAFIILMHGIMHWFIQNNTVPLETLRINCYTDIQSDASSFGRPIFAIFSFCLAIIILGVGFYPVISRPMITIISIIFAVIVVYITDNSGTEGKEGELILPGLFVVAHPLSCITGLLTTKTQMFSPSVGWLFALCTLIGILELTLCKEILKPFGGHVWYDVTLHSAVILSLPYFCSPSASPKGKNN
ncbi:hypothetical protein FRACYDRAFT_246653 [Fragilariopsis cylindrus CCMP1102]|uniref:Uncharacterized protein n=1 Tax=Fragilariopsis cylindrus CCMP1102 TaxID=635003 RepID=A0A1E7EYA0_9STRA|nr:hypothetical protein FRACYDRAFT_246653 [Fragilariopsis cylindrus CCMP1102]|eukprot:OEU10785.1 hypothetical protein FRACYDRAFT_246653 [Fragilariopsis cylindrus CCMP1102]